MKVDIPGLRSQLHAFQVRSILQAFQTSWKRAWLAVSVQPPSLVLFRQLIAHYKEPERRYHTTQHLDECLSLFERVRHLANQPAEVELAIWFHDAIYNPRGHSNEHESTAFARQVLQAGDVDAQVIDRICSLIMATQHDQLPVTADGKLLVDIDLAILGASSDRFAEYESQVRSEYAFVPLDEFTQKRASILTAFLHRAFIFNTNWFFLNFEQQARHNLESSLFKYSKSGANQYS